ncbi:FKBP-type peptidyl-prolyl cis-trans isomerase [Candidatus Saccharibacteria bacterium]|nr:FKBP-type peptidyl-prolyl cis-trans isomerase [Candidatus Saccharibacteria bacterium]
MEEKALKTSWKQRLVIGLIAFLLLGSSIAIYVFIVLGQEVDYSRMTTTQLQTAYEKTTNEYTEIASELSNKYFDEFVAYKSNVKGYNSNTANANGVTTKDLKEGDGEELGENYSAYYIGWCSDESIFDSSLDDYEEPTSLLAPLNVTPDNLIEGWYIGVQGMKYGGIREITIPGTLAYGDKQEICGGTNSPLKFIILAIPEDKRLTEISESLNKIYTALANAYSESYSSDSSNEDYSTSEEMTEEK